MLHKLRILNVVFLVVSAIFLVVTIEVSTSEATNKTDSLTDNKTIFTNKTANETGTEPDNSIILNVAEVGDEEQYRWVDISGEENPTLHIMANKEYNFKISNPTDEEHQLIIDKADGKSSEIAKSEDIGPDSKNIELIFKTDQIGELGYHCKYHPDMMNGTINVTQ